MFYVFWMETGNVCTKPFSWHSNQCCCYSIPSIMFCLKIIMFTINVRIMCFCTSLNLRLWWHFAIDCCSMQHAWTNIQFLVIRFSMLIVSLTELFGTLVFNSCYCSYCCRYSTTALVVVVVVVVVGMIFVCWFVVIAVNAKHFYWSDQFVIERERKREKQMFR